nr:uncharacterized protein LOC105849185 [Hydra vulgaris]
MSAYIFCELNYIQFKLTSLEQRQEKLEERFCNDPVDQNISQIQFPIFNSLLQYSEVKKHPKNMLSWMMLEGGLTFHHHILLIMLLTHAIQKRSTSPKICLKLQLFTFSPASRKKKLS